MTDPTVPVDAAEVVERLAAVRDELRVLTQSPFGSFAETEAGRVVAGVEQITRAAEALSTACAGGIDRGQAWTVRGYRSFAQWWRVHTHRRRSTSTATQLLARDLRERLPLTERALAEGRIGGEHARVMARFTKTGAQRAQLLDESMGEAFLVDQAQKLGVEDFTTAIKAWAIRTDPEAADRGWREASAQRELFVAPVLDGIDIRGWLGVEEGQVVREALNAIIGTPSADDGRTPAQRRADALVHLCRLFLDGGLAQPGARIRPHIAVTVDFATVERLVNATGGQVTAGELIAELTRTQRARRALADPAGGGGAADRGDAFGLPDGTAAAAGDVRGRADEACSPGALDGVRDQAGCCGGVSIPATINLDLLRGAAPATFADGTPISPGQLATLLCDGEFHRIIFGPRGQVLDSGRTQRLFTAAQTRAIIARDRHCQYPGCDVPPGQGEIHHCLWWYHQGRTSTENGILLCWWHHTLVHQRHLTITRHDHPDHSWWAFTTPDGRPIQTIQPPSGWPCSHDRRPPDPPRRE